MFQLQQLLRPLLQPPPQRLQQQQQKSLLQPKKQATPIDQPSFHLLIPDTVGLI